MSDFLLDGMYIVLLLTSFSTAGYIIRNRRSKDYAYILLVFSFALAGWCAAYVFADLLKQLDQRLHWSLVFIGVTVIPIAILAFVLHYTHRAQILTPLNVGLISLGPVIIQVLWWTNSKYHILFSPDTGLLKDATVIFWINVIYTNSLVAVGVGLLALTLFYSRQTYKWQSLIVVAGVATPVIVGMLSIPEISFLGKADFKPAAFTVTLLVLTYGLVYRGMLDIVPIARDIVVEQMSDGWMMLDTENRIVDLNRTAEKVLGVKREKLFGKSADSILSNWGLLAESKQETEIPGSINFGDEWRFVSVRITPLLDQANGLIGKTIIWRDMTERRKLEETRQRARADMFILLHSISGAASRAVDLHEFLSESIFQVMYSFQSNACAIYLLDDDKDDGVQNKRRLLLSAQQGFDYSSVSKVISLGDSPLIDEVIKGWTPKTVEDAETNPDVPDAFKLDERFILVLLPLLIDNESIGLFALARKEGPHFTEDEITRLGVVSEEIASSIHGGRRRQLAIALAERQRLVRDLHDSVTQKLYGLVALTEAAKSGLETGETEKLAGVMDRLGDNARQALKEMRLFLHEMKPVDLERVGLVAALHQRLESVEGRADIKHHFSADEDVDLAPDKQVALYYIAQEALNNIMKHARAKSVVVQLKKFSDSVILTIQDDGCGFTPSKESPGGMGLRNMQERAILVGGTVEITSSPNHGTCVRASVRHDGVMNG